MFLGASKNYKKSRVMIALKFSFSSCFHKGKQRGKHHGVQWRQRGGIRSAQTWRNRLVFKKRCISIPWDRFCLGFKLNQNLHAQYIYSKFWISLNSCQKSVSQIFWGITNTLGTWIHFWKHTEIHNLVQNT